MGSRAKRLRDAVADRQQELCTCGGVWDGPVHFTKGGKLRADIAKDVTHVPTGNNGIMRKAIAAVQAGRKAPKKDA